VISIDRESMQVWQDGKEVRLTPLQYALLVTLADAAGRVLTRDEIARRVWGTDAATCDKTMKMTVASLRKALGDDPKQPRVIETVRGVGYRLAKHSLASGTLAEAAARLHILASASEGEHPAEAAAALRDTAAALIVRAEALEAQAGTRTGA